MGSSRALIALTALAYLAYYVQARVHISKLPDFTGGAVINQKVDHFDENNTATFEQRYFVNQQQAIPGSNVNFLLIGGANTLSINDIAGNETTNVIVGYARRQGAYLYALEHRFYGRSRPTADQTTESLALLSSRQAIEDIADFIRLINGDSTNQRWVLFGGYYGGSLALWFRQKYPKLVSGAVASSAPLLGQVDFYGYLEGVQSNIMAVPRPPGVSIDCYVKMAQGFQTIYGTMQTPTGRTTLSNMFSKALPRLDSFVDNDGNSLLDTNVVSLFYESIIQPYKDASRQPDGMKTLGTMCADFTQTGADPMTVLSLKAAPGNLNYSTIVAGLSQDQWDDADSDQRLETYNARAWMYQRCTEFGWFQSTDTGNNIFYSAVPTNLYLNQCKDVFGIATEDLKKGVDATNHNYGERSYYTGTNVVSTYGTVDPGNALSKKDSLHYSVVIRPIQNGGQSEDLAPACHKDSDNIDHCNNDVTAAQDLIAKNIDAWLNGPFTAPDNIVITDTIGQRPQKDDAYPVEPASLKYLTREQSIAKRAKKAAREALISAEEKRQHARNVFTGRRRHGLQMPPPQQAADTWPPNMREGYLTQPFDHFDNLNPGRFNQRFFINEKFGTTDGPNFLMIGGEGPESDRWVLNEDLAWVTYAQNVGANLYLLEHRYYGESIVPTNDLQYLTSAQMLYDCVRFIQTAKNERNLTGQWITFGGSYSGALSAWAREWFPDVITGAVGSSGPVEAKNDFFEYLQVVEKVIGTYSQDCLKHIGEAFMLLQQLVQSKPGQQAISDKFNLNPPWWANKTTALRDQDVQLVFSNLYSYFQGVVQYSNDNAGKGDVQNVQNLCAIINDNKYNGNPLDALQAVVIWFESTDAPEKNITTIGQIPMNSDNRVENQKLADLRKFVGIDVHNDTADPDKMASVLWTWQTCNEFGYYQTTDYGFGVFGNPTPLNFFIEMCEFVFGDEYNMDRVEQNIGNSIHQYGGRHMFKGTNVVLPNGDSDPWHALGLLDATVLESQESQDTVKPILIQGTAHCADMYAARDADPPGLTQARHDILNQIRIWLGKSTLPPDTTTAAPTESTASGPTTPSTAAPTTSSVSATSTFVAMVVALLALLL